MQAPDPSHLLQFLLAIALFASIGANVALALRGRRRDVAFIPDPVSKVEFRDEMTKHEIGGHSRMFAELRSEMNAAMNASNFAGEQRAEKIHNRINDILKAVAHMDGILERLPRGGADKSL